MGKHKISPRMNDKQERAILNNNLIRCIIAAERAANVAGHYDFEARLREVEELFRQKLGDKK